MPSARRPRLQGCHVVSLRPVGEHAGLRRAAAREGARVLALSPWKLELRDNATVRAQLRRALQAPRVVFTSPAAVRAANALLTLRQARDRAWFAVGAGTAQALRRAGAANVHAPVRMDSEGLLALPALSDVAGFPVGLVTAPDGRERIAATLLSRGARLIRADVYARVPVTLRSDRIALLRRLRGPVWLALSSGEALQRVLVALPTDAQPALHRARVVAASARLAELAGRAGFAHVVQAASAQPRDLVAAIAAAG